MANGIAYSPDGRFLALACENARILLWDLQTECIHKELIGHFSSVYCVAFSPDGKRLASASADWKVNVWDMLQMQEIGTLSAHSKQVTHINFAKDGLSIVSGSTDGSLRKWNLETMSLQTTMLHEKCSPVEAIAYESQGRLIASAA
jgi:WD40 repeat protein